MTWFDLVAIMISCGVIVGGFTLGFSHAWTAFQCTNWATARHHALMAGLYAAPVSAFTRILWAVWP
jgi:hypothetical protein